MIELIGVRNDRISRPNYWGVFVNLYFTISMVVTIIKTNLTRKQT